MPVDTTHRDHDSNSEMWKRCRDAIEGLDAMREAKETYLPKLASQAPASYDAYLKRADWYGGTARTVEGFSGAAFRKAPTVVVPTAAEGWLEDITLTGVPLNTFMRNQLRELLSTGRYGVYADMPEEESEAESRPYLVQVRAEQIVSWRDARIDGQMVRDRIVIKEAVDEEDPADTFVSVSVDQYRVLEIVGGEYTQQLWRRSRDDSGNEKGDFVPFGPPIVPRFRDRGLLQVPELRELTGGGVPLWFGTPSDTTSSVEKSPVKDLADLNLSMFRNSADLENAIHFTGFPQPYAAGFPVEKELYIGTNQAWVSNQANAKAGYAEYTGAGLDHVLTNIERKKKEMAAMGARLLEEQKKAAEAADTVRIRQSGEQATLVGMIEVVETVTVKAVSFALIWGGQSSGELEIGINRDLVQVRATPLELQALNEALQSGNMSFETYYWNLENLELTRPGVDAEEEKEAIDNEAEGVLELRAQEQPPAGDDKEERARRNAEAASAA